MNRKVLVQIGIGVILVLAIFLVRCAKDFRMPSFGGQETAGSGPVPVAADVLQYYLQGADLPTTFQLITGGQVPQELVDKFLAGKITGITKGSPVIVAAPLSGQSSTAPTYTPQPTVRPTRTPTPIVMRPMTGTATIAFPPAPMLVMKGNENSLLAKVKVGGKELSSSYWAKFDGSCGSLWCRGPLQMVVPITGTFSLPPTLAVVNGEISYQAADVGSNYDLAKLSFDVSLNAPTSKDMKFGDETGVTEIWTVGKTGGTLVLLKVRIQRWDAINLQLTPVEVVVSFSAGDLPGFIGPIPAPTSTPTATTTPTQTGAKLLIPTRTATPTR